VSTVVFLNDSGNSACAWLPLARTLIAAHHQVVVFSYRSTDPDSEEQGVRDALAIADKARAGGRYVLIGASLGGRIVIEVAAQHPDGLASIVCLSGERMVQGYGDILGQARRVVAPALYVGARDDFYTNGSQQQRQLHNAMRGKPNLLIQRDGSNHGTALLDTNGVDGKVVTPQVVAFVNEQLR